MATKVAEATGESGDKLVKRVLGHSDQSVTAIYNRYAYVKEVRRVLGQWGERTAGGGNHDLRRRHDRSVLAEVAPEENASRYRP